jgi:hypothetical protein
MYETKSLIQHATKLILFLFYKFWAFSIVSLFLNHYVSRDVSSLGGPPIEASSIDRTHQSRSPEDEGRAIPRNVVV